MIQGRSIVLGAALALGLVAVLRPVGTTAQGAASTLGARRCVGMFVAPEYRGQTIPATLNGMKVVGEAPCGGQFLGFIERIPEAAQNTEQFMQLMVMQGFWIGLVVAFIVEAVEMVIMVVKVIKEAIEG